jgi:hypothetical protein
VGLAAPVQASDPSSGDTYRDILTRHGLDELVVDGAIDPQPAQSATAPAGAFAAVFAEVRVDRDLGVLRVARMTSVIDGGRVLNEKTARSQITGATVMAIGMTLLEETVFDPGTGRIANATFGDYPIPSTPMCRTSTWCSSASRTGSARSGPRASARSEQWECPPRSPTPSTTPPAGASGRCPSPWTNCCSPGRAFLYAASRQRWPLSAIHNGAKSAAMSTAPRGLNNRPGWSATLPIGCLQRRHLTPARVRTCRQQFRCPARRPSADGDERGLV